MKHRVMIIDDEQSVRDSLAAVLATYGFRTASCGNAHQALEAIRKSAPDCVVLDVRMPEMDGLALQRMLAQTAANLPVVIITGHADIAMAVQAMRNGASDFIEKPIDDEQWLHRSRLPSTRNGTFQGRGPTKNLFWHASKPDRAGEVRG